MDTKRFKSPTGKEIYCASTSGHTWRIGADYVTVPEHGWTLCYSLGCVSEDMVANLVAGSVQEAAVAQVANGMERKQVVKTILRGWMDNNELDKFNKQGNPNINTLSAEAEFKVERGMAMEMMGELQQELLDK